MKKIVSLLLCLTAMLCLVVGCATADPKPSTEPSASVAPTTEPSPTEDPTTEPTQEPSPSVSIAPTEEPTTEPTQEPSPSVSKEDLFAGVSFVNRRVVYNGTRQKLEVSGAPEGAEIVYSATEKNTAEDNVDVYTENGARKPGTYGVKAVVTIDGESREYTARLIIGKASLIIKGDALMKDVYAPDPEFTYTITGLLPCDEFVVLPEETAAEEDPAAPSVLPSAEPSASLLPNVTPSETPAEDVDGGAKFYGELVATPESGRYAEIGTYRVAFGGVKSDCYNISYSAGTLTIRGYETDLIGGTDGGLKKGVAGGMTYGGKTVMWQGINYFSLFAGCFSGGEVNEQAVQNAFAGLEELAAMNVKAIRFSCGHFYASGWQQNWFGDSKDGVSRAEMTMYTLKRIFNKAASLNIGLIPSVYWTSNISGLFEGEEMSTGWGLDGSQTQTFALEYQEMLLNAVNDHPALFMWEFGNEWNLSADVSSDADTTKHLTAEIIHDFREKWSALIQSYNEGYNRVIGSGDGILRSSQYNRWKYESWTEDSLQEHKEVVAYLNPGITAVSVHIYGGAKLVILQEKKIAEAGGNNLSAMQQLEIRNQLRKQYYEDPDSVEQMFEEYGIIDGYMDKYSGKINDCDTLAGQYRLILSAAEEIGATAYVGETGIGYTLGETVLQNAEYARNLGWYPDVTYDDMTYYSEQVTKAQKETGMPLILYWNYEYNVEITSRGDQIYWGGWALNNDDPSDDWVPFGDHGTGTEYSMSLKNWEKARRVLAEVKKVNDAWDEKNA